MLPAPSALTLDAFGTALPPGASLAVRRAQCRAGYGDAVLRVSETVFCGMHADGATNPPGRILSAVMGCDGSLTDLLKVPGGGSAVPVTPENVDQRLNTIHMEGRETFKHAVTRMCQASEQALTMAGLTAADVKMVIPHQANLRIISAIADRLHIPEERIFINLHKYGNTSAATIPVALDEASRAGAIQRGDVMLLVAFGGGFTWASTVLVW